MLYAHLVALPLLLVVQDPLKRARAPGQPVDQVQLERMAKKMRPEIEADAPTVNLALPNNGI